MSNRWKWVALLDRPLELQDVRDAIACAEGEGYAPWNPGMWNTSPGPDGSVEFDSREAAVVALAKSGGELYLEMQKPETGPFAIALSFFKELQAVGLDRPAVRRDGERAVEYLLSVYLALCRHFRPRYGYVLDEWNTEEAAIAPPPIRDWWDMVKATSALFEGEPPPLLYCVNVFENPIYERLRPRLAAIEHEVIPLGDYGVAVRLARYPGIGRPARLEADGMYR